MASQTDRNPSPPPEILKNDEDFVPDRIGNSMYSKRWLYKTLMKMLKIVESVNTEKKIDDGITLPPVEMHSNNQNIVELDDKIEEDACTLWDMSANSEVAEFLCECNACEIFLTIIEHTKSPRLLEIVVGILGNMSSFNSTCQYISKNKALVRSVVDLSGCSDSCSLVQLFRLLNCGIAREICQEEWFAAIAEDLFFMENLKSILVNNLCHDVLKGLLEFLDRVLNDNSTYCSMWSEESYVLAIIESGKQLLKCNQYEDLDSFFSVLNTLCLHSPDLSIYAKQFGSLKPIFHGYFIKLGDEESLPQVARVTVISYAFAIYGNLLLSKNIPQEHVVLETDVFKAILNISKLVKTLLTNLQKNQKNKNLCSSTEEAFDPLTKTEETNSSASEDSADDELENWNILLEAIVYVAKACSSHTNQDDDLQILEEITNMPECINDSGT